MSEKSDTPTPLCWFCRYFHYFAAHPDYSEVTPGSEFEIACDKGKWEFDQYNTSRAEFAAMISAAASCPDYDIAEDIVADIALAQDERNG